MALPADNPTDKVKSPTDKVKVVEEVIKKMGPKDLAALPDLDAEDFKLFGQDGWRSEIEVAKSVLEDIDRTEAEIDSARHVRYRLQGFFLKARRAQVRWIAGPPNPGGRRRRGADRSHGRGESVLGL